MKRVAIEKARSRLARANEALQRLRTSRYFQQFEPAWTDYLVSLNTVYSILEQGSRGSPKSEAWFGRKKNERRRDPLLQYLHQARNSDEHGIEPVVEHDPGHVAIGKRGEAVHIVSGIFGPGMVNATLAPVEGKLPSIEVVHAHPKMISVTDNRFGDTFDPPTEHLGRPLRTGSPTEVAELGFEYHKQLIDEAERLIP